MARFAIGATVRASGGSQVGAVSDVLNASGTATAQAAVASAVATLVADGASPTQAHVTALNSAWSTLNSDIAAGSLAQAGDVVVSFNATTVKSVTELRRVLLKAVEMAEGNYAGLGLIL